MVQTNRAGPRVFLIGASGAFGSRLAEGLAREPGLALVLAGRRRAPLARLADRLALPGHERPSVVVTDRRRLAAADLHEVDIVIDAAGPFRCEEIAVVEAAIAAGCHYLDLADGRGFVAAITGFEAAARDAGVAVLSGVSTTPALSHAVLDELTAGWQRIDTLTVAVCPGNRAPRGLAVVRSILSYAGRPVRLLRDGAWSSATGWGLTRRVEIAGLGTRLASLCETPDLDLLVARYQPRAEALFLAGLELPILHHGLSLMSKLVCGRLLRSLAPLAPPLRLAADLVRSLGSDRGGMLVEASGRDRSGQPCRARWSLVAEAGRGPYVPTLAALALVRRLRDEKLVFRGAAPCVGQLTLAEFSADLARLGITTNTEATPLGPSLFRRALGRAFDRLPPETRRLHDPDPVLVAGGTAEVEGAEGLVGRLFARLFGLPEASAEAPLRVVIEATPDGGERWTRVTPSRVMRSLMTAPDPLAATVEERFGPISIVLALAAGPDGLTMTSVGGRWWRIPIPRVLLPRVRARESAEPGRHCFDVAVALPFLGRLVRYRGALELDA